MVEECSLTVEASDQILYERMSARGCVCVSCAGVEMHVCRIVCVCECV